jgi:geranylgeranyl diphosphate synthase, type I
MLRRRARSVMMFAYTSMSLDLDQCLGQLGEITDRGLRAAVANHLAPRAERLALLLEYHLGWRDPELAPLGTPAPAGKRLRPALVLLVAQAVRGETPPAARPAAIAIELIHNFSLVHDDIQDRSALRRHRPTVWSVWGMPQGINVGDALFALAQVVLAEPGSALAARLTTELNKASLGLAAGQFLDIDLQDGRIAPSLAAYEAMVAGKTGALFACACRLGAMAAEASEPTCEAYAAYGAELGIAFQEQDDLLGVWGRSAETGKPDAADIIERKRGLPAVLALSRKDAPDWLRHAYDNQPDELAPETIQHVIAHFDALGLRATIEQRVETRYRRALECLDNAAPREPARGYLSAICDALVSRRT